MSSSFYLSMSLGQFRGGGGGGEGLKSYKIKGNLCPFLGLDLFFLFCFL